MAKLSDTLPPLIFGSATMNYQFNVDPYALGPTEIVQRAMAHGIRAFDTSPYYGPAETILGDALATVNNLYRREDYFILTKCGRIAADCFDYSPEWIRYSVKRSCARMNSTYLDVVYLHDAEFVSPAEVLIAIQELRRIRAENGSVKHVGICGYPVNVLCDLAEMILRETGEPLDIVQSYSNFCVQNTRLLSQGLDRLVKAGVDVVPNASPLSMGLLRGQGPPIGAMGNWHPAPDGLRQACAKMGEWAGEQGEKLEVIALRWAMEEWLKQGAIVGTRGKATDGTAFAVSHKERRLGVSVIGVSKLEELEETMRIWRSVLDGLEDKPGEGNGILSFSDAQNDHEWSLNRRQHVRAYARHIRESLGDKWRDYTWASPDTNFVNKLNTSWVQETALKIPVVEEREVALLTPPPENDNEVFLTNATAT